MPAYNAARWIGEAIESALGQTWEDFELVISDDASTDSTLSVASRYADPRVRLTRNRQHLGQARNHNRTIELSRGRFVKFLHADDILLPDCITAMVGRALEDERIGLVFCPREIRVESDAGEEGVSWSKRHSRLHEHFEGLQANNDGRALLEQLVDAELRENWIGEPTAVLLTRSALERGRLFNVRLHQTSDLELWMRIMLQHRVGFVDRPLCVYRRHTRSVWALNARTARAWLDSLWTIEALLREPSLPPRERESLERLRRDAIIRALRSQVARLFRGQVDTQLPAYLRYRAHAYTGRARFESD